MEAVFFEKYRAAVKPAGFKNPRWLSKGDFLKNFGAALKADVFRIFSLRLRIKPSKVHDGASATHQAVRGIKQRHRAKFRVLCAK